MRSPDDKMIAEDITGYLTQHENKSLLRFITCGSVDDGKSTLIGRLLYESKNLFDDQLDTVTADSKKWGTQGKELDLALLVDGLAAEREQGITIDVAYRFFSTEQRKFIVADTPGHEQYTRNMVTGASSADAAIVICDARQGVLTQTRRHTYLLSLLGIRNVILAVNKMDLAQYDESVYLQIVEDYRAFLKSLSITEFIPIPISALSGVNIMEQSPETPWYHGPSLMSCLETIEVDDEFARSKSFRMPVQWVNRPTHEFRGFSGAIVSGTVKPGDSVRVQPSGISTEVERIVTFDGDLPVAVAGQSVTLTLKDNIDISRGDVLSNKDDPAGTADQFECAIVWMHESPMLPGRPYLLKSGTKTIPVTITSIKYQVNVNTLEHVAAKHLDLNGIGICNINTEQPIAFDSYADNRDMGSFILIDRASNNTVGAGMLHFALRRSDNIHMQAVDIDKTRRSILKGQKSCVIWFTGLSGSGKSTIANLVEKKLATAGHHTYLLDGDNVRHGLNKDLGFTDEDRVENIRRIGEVASLMVDAGLIVLTAFISPFQSERNLARSLVKEGEFLEVYVETPLALAEERDPKGLYKKARRGELKNFTGIDSPYEAPEAPEIAVETSAMDAEQCADSIISELRRRGMLDIPELG